MDSYVIQVQPHDELTVIVDKIIKTEAQRVYLLISEESHIAQNALNLRLLKREAESLEKDIVVVSASPRIQELALKASLQVHQETDELKRGADKDSGKFFAAPVLRDIVTPRKQREKGGVPEDEEKPSSALKTLREKEDDFSKHEKAEITGKLPPSSSDIGGKQKAIESFWTRKTPSLPSSGFRPSLPSLPVGSLLSPFGFIIRRANFLKYLIFLFLIFSAGVAFLSFYKVLPKAMVYLKPFVEDVVLEMNMAGNASISEVNTVSFTAPAQIFEKSVSSSKSVMTSEEKEIKERARGVISVYNAYSSAPQTLVETTRFVSEKGKLFRTTETIVVPGAKVEEGSIVPSFTSVNVVAAEAGEEYNIGPSSFSIPGFRGGPKYIAFYGKSDSDMRGGRVARVKVVSANDYNKAKNELVKNLEAKAQEGLELSVGEGFIIPQGARQRSETDITSSKEVGDEAREFIMSASVSLQAFAIRESDIRKMLEEKFAAEFPEKKLVSNGGDIAYRVERMDFKTGTFDAKVSYAARAMPQISGDKIKDDINGKEEKEVRRVLSSHPGLKEARVTFWPFWVNEIPKDKSRIEIILEP